MSNETPRLPIGFLSANKIASTEFKNSHFIKICIWDTSKTNFTNFIVCYFVILNTEKEYPQVW